MKLFLFSIFSILMLNCSNIKKDNQSDKYLDFFYFKGNKLFPFRLNCKSIRSEMFRDDVKYEKIEDREYIERFTKEYEKLKSRWNEGG